MKVAAIQMVSTGSVQDNLQQARTLLEQAAAQGAELAVLPEYFCLIGQHDADKLAIQEPFGGGPIQQAMADAARALGREQRIGTLEVGKQADFALWRIARPADLSYAIGFNPCIGAVHGGHVTMFDATQSGKG